MPKYRKKGLAAGVETVDAARFDSVRDVLAAQGLPWYPGRGTYAANTDPSTGDLLVIAGGRSVLVPTGHWVVTSGTDVAVLDHSSFHAAYEPVKGEHADS